MLDSDTENLMAIFQIISAFLSIIVLLFNSINFLIQLRRGKIQ
jgi:hypothetical protein